MKNLIGGMALALVVAGGCTAEAQIVRELHPSSQLSAPVVASTQPFHVRTASTAVAAVEVAPAGQRLQSVVIRQDGYVRLERLGLVRGVSFVTINSQVFVIEYTSLPFTVELDVEDATVADVSVAINLDAVLGAGSPGSATISVTGVVIDPIFE